MQQHSMTAMAARPTIAVVHGICADQLGAATPCSEYDIQTLINHLLFWGRRWREPGASRPWTRPQRASVSWTW